MVLTLLFLLLTLAAVVLLAAALIWVLVFLVRKARGRSAEKTTRGLKRTAVIFAVVLILNTGLVTVSQLTASTPPIRDEAGNIPEGSIAELVRVELNGRREWISIRGWDSTKPVLLFLAGGPGGTQLAAVRHELAVLEKYFVVVGWDQPGSGKSYYAGNSADITTETYIEDGYALTEYLCDRFGQEKIYLVGESWGSALGIFLIDHHPDSYYAFIGTGQMIDFVETERTDYAMAWEIARERGDTAILDKLEKNGQPPYYGDDVTWKSAVYLNYLSACMVRNPAISNPGYNTFRDLFSSEYGLLDKINYVWGVIDTFNRVYPQLYGTDLRSAYTELQVPVYFFLGRHDLNAPTAFVEEYVQILDVPVKEIVWFEHSGHSPWINEREQFVEELLECFGVGDTAGIPLEAHGLTA